MTLYGRLTEETTFTGDDGKVLIPAGALIEADGEDFIDCGESWAYVRDGEHFGAAAIISIDRIRPE